jgi:hypothetical protein
MEPAHRLLHRLRQIEALRDEVVDQMRDDFGVGFGREGVALGAQLGLELEVVLDDAVVDQRDAAAGDMRMRVGLGDAAMRGPARMRDAERADAGLGLQLAVQLHHLADGAAQAQAPAAVAASLGDGEAGRVVAAVFEPAQTLQQDRGYIMRRDGADDSAHGVSVELAGAPF